MRTLIILLLILALVVVGIVYLKHSTTHAARVESNGLQPKPAKHFQDSDLDIQQPNQRNVMGDHPEWPAVASDQKVISHEGYSLVYAEAHEQAIWVAYELTAEETTNDVERGNHFIEDPEISTGSATNADYAKSGYDRGHLAPAADMGWSTTAMEESFYFSNMSPQEPGFNRGICKKLETQVREWARQHESIYVVTGPVLSSGLPTIGPNKVSVPNYYYKVILDGQGSGMHGIGFILPNASSQQPLSSFAVSIDSVEKVTGLDFFPSLPSEIIVPLEGERCLNCWGL